MTKNGMKIGVVGLGGNWSSEKLADALAERTGYRLLIEADELTADLASGKLFHRGQDLSALDALVIKKIGETYSPSLLDRLEVLRYAESKGLPFFSSPSRIMRLLDRLSCTVSLAAAGIPMPPTVITESAEEAEGAVNNFGEAVFKPLYSTKARGMALIAKGPEARMAIEKFKNDGNPVMYIQKKITGPGWDMGVSFLGGEYIATYARVGAGKSWNTTTANGGKYKAMEPSKEILEIARKAQSVFGLDFTCVDIMETADGPIVFEVSAFGGFRGLLEGNGVDAAALIADYAIRKISNE